MINHIKIWIMIDFMFQYPHTCTKKPSVWRRLGVYQFSHAAVWSMNIIMNNTQTLFQIIVINKIYSLLLYTFLHHSNNSNDSKKMKMKIVKWTCIIYVYIVYISYINLKSRPFNRWSTVNFYFGLENVKKKPCENVGILYIRHKILGPAQRHVFPFIFNTCTYTNYQLQYY